MPGPSSTPRTTPFASPAVLYLFISIITFAVYLPALGNGFVNWDDNRYILENPDIQALGPGLLSYAFTSVVHSNWHPLTVLTYALDYRLWGLDPMGYHLTNTVLHAANTFLVGLLSLRLTGLAFPGGGKGVRGGQIAAGAAAALLFGLHPIHVESVAWVSERKDVLYALFYLLSVLAYLKYATAGKGPVHWYLACLLLFALSLLSKPMAVTLPVVLLVADYYPLKRFRPGAGTVPTLRLLLEKAPFISLCVVSAYLTIWAQSAGQAVVAIVEHPLAARIDVAVKGLVFYLHKTLLPVGLAPVYPRPAPGEAFDIVFFVSLAVLAAVTAACMVRARRGAGAWLALWLYYIVSLLPVIGLVQVGNQAAADRYMYLPSLALFILAGGAAFVFVSRRGSRGAMAVAAVAVAAAVAMAVLTVRQTGFWSDSVTLWTRQISVYPERAPLAYYNRGNAYDSLGAHAEAIADFTAAIRLGHEPVDSHINRGISFGKSGRFSRAIEDFDSAIRLAPDRASAYLNRGAAFLSLGLHADAVRDFTRAIELDPDDAVAYYNLGIAYAGMGLRGRAIESMKAARSLGLKEAAEYLEGLD